MMRDIRRHYEARAKAEAKRKLLQWGLPVTPKRVGTQAATHNTCACWACTYKDKEPKRKIERDLRLLQEGV